MQAADEPHPAVQEVLAQLSEFDVTPLRQYGPEQARELFDSLRSDVDGPEVADVTDRTVPGFQDGPEVPVRLYRPDIEGPVPTVVFSHGGGFVVGSVETHDVLCRHLTNALGATVVSVDYRLAPEHPFPAALEDAYAATEWAAANPPEIDGDGHLVVAGDSAGGNLATATTLLARRLPAGPAVDYQVLLYPVVSADDDWPSREQFGRGYFLDERDMEWFHESYLPSPVHDANPLANPLEGADLSGLPPATVVTAGFDPLRDEGAAYARALERAGVEVTYRNYEVMIHGFVSMLAEPVALDAAEDAIAAVAGDVEEGLG